MQSSFVTSSGESEIARRIVYQWDEGTDHCHLPSLCKFGRESAQCLASYGVISLIEIGGAASFEVRQAYKQFIAGVVGLVDREVPSEELGEVALTIYRLFGEQKEENDLNWTAKNK